MIFRQLFDATSSTYTYLLACEQTRLAVLIDPVYEQMQRDLALLHELNLTLAVAADTHCHADHVTAAWLLKQKTGCKIASAAAIGAEDVDLPLCEGDTIPFGSEHLTVLSTPGHTDGCMTFVSGDESMAFTGDALLIRGCGRCDFQQGDAHTLFHSVTGKIFALPDHCAIYPAHDYGGRTRSSVAEERAFNTRLGGLASEADFVGYMNNLQLPHPKQIDHALPANLKSGRPETGELPPEPEWGPVQYSFSGIPEIDADWVVQHPDQVNLLDVRETSELESPVDRLAGALTIPLGELRGSLDKIPKDKPVVCLCRSGRRSAMAVNILKGAGFGQVANVAGGVLRWKELS